LPPKNPPIVFTATPARFSQLRKILKANTPVNGKYNDSTRFMLKTPPAIQRALREIAADEGRTIVNTTNVILGLGLRAYAKLAQGVAFGVSETGETSGTGRPPGGSSKTPSMTPEQAVDSVVEEIRS
jgi:hypothetical protein